MDKESRRVERNDFMEANGTRYSGFEISPIYSWNKVFLTSNDPQVCDIAVLTWQDGGPIYAEVRCQLVDFFDGDDEWSVRHFSSKDGQSLEDFEREIMDHMSASRANVEKLIEYKKKAKEYNDRLAELKKEFDQLEWNLSK